MTSPVRVASPAGATPDTRDRYADLLRVSSLGVVVGGHWLMITLVPGPKVGNLLAVVPAIQAVTWLLQVMPVFFLVGGFSHATAWASVRRRGGGYADFARSRAARLLRPTAVFAAVWLGAAVVIELAGHDAGLVRTATRTVAQPLWFLGVYLGLVALVPALWRLHVRLGRAAWAVPVALGAGTAVVDAVRFSQGRTGLAYLNVALVWIAVHQAGFFWADGSLWRAGRRLAAGLAAGGLAAVVALTVTGPYPISMVGVPGAPVSNMSPPTLALFAHAAWLIGVVLLAGPAARRWLRRPRVWRAVVAANGAAMTAFLWHLTALVLLLTALFALQVHLPAPGTGAWWLSRPLWLAALAAITGGLVAAFGAADRPRRTASTAIPGIAAARRGAAALAGTGIGLCTLGVLSLSAVGFGGALAGRRAHLLLLPVTPLGSVATLAAGCAVLAAGRLLSGRAADVRRSG